MRYVLGVSGLVFALLDVLLILNTIFCLEKNSDKKVDKISKLVNVRMALIIVCSVITCVIEVVTLFIE